MATATLVKKNGISKKTTTPTKAVQEKLAKEAIGEKTTPITKEIPKSTVLPEAKPVINLDDRMLKFEEMKGLAQQRERLNNTLTELNRFKYNQSDSSSFYLKDSHGLEFKTTNSNLTHLVTNHLKITLEARKKEIEKQLIAFEL